MKTTMHCQKHPSTPLFYCGNGGFVCKFCNPKVVEAIIERRAIKSAIRQLNKIAREEIGV